MKRLILFCFVTGGVAVAIQAAGAADPRYPDWPCVQVKVPELSVAALWGGPPLGDAVERWEKDARLKELVALLAARRTPLDEAQKLAAEFISGDEASKQDKAKLLFAGLFDNFNQLRTDVLAGIERFTRRQREFAERIRSETLKLRELQDANADAKQLEEMSNQLQWDTRIFEDRRRTISYVCEVPVTIERRLFALGRTIQQAAE